MRSSPITKDQLAWLFLRGFGLYLGYNALQGFAAIIFTAGAFKDVGFGRIGGAMMGSVMFMTLGSVYFLFFEAVAHQLLMKGTDDFGGAPNPKTTSSRQLPPEKEDPRTTVSRSAVVPRRKLPSEKEDPRTTLTASEGQTFSQWLAHRPDMSNRILEDQIALFRDYQRGDGND